MTASKDFIIGLEADPTDPEDFDVTREEVERALAERRSRGAQKAATKTPVSIRLDADLVAVLRASGRGWQARVNAILRKAVL